MKKLCLCTLNFSYKLKLNWGMWLDYPGSWAGTVITRSSNIPNYIQILQLRQNLCSIRLVETRGYLLKAGWNIRLEINYTIYNNRIDIYIYLYLFVYSSSHHKKTLFRVFWQKLHEFKWIHGAGKFLKNYSPSFCQSIPPQLYYSRRIDVTFKTSLQIL